MTMTEFFSMGGYGFYIWTSFGASALLMLIEVIMVRRQHGIVLRRLKRLSRVSRESSEAEQ